MVAGLRCMQKRWMKNFTLLHQPASRVKVFEAAGPFKQSESPFKLELLGGTLTPAPENFQQKKPFGVV